MSGDLLVSLLQKTYYCKNAFEIAELIRVIIPSFDELEDGEIYTDSMYSLIPTAHSIPSKSIYKQHKITFETEMYKFVNKGILNKGSYNFVYEGELVVNNKHTHKIIIKESRLSRADFRIYFMENIIHALLNVMDIDNSGIAKFYFPFKIKSTNPEYIFGSIMPNLGSRSLYEFIKDDVDNDECLFSFATQIAWILYQLQSQIKYMHRDLKANNIMIINTKEKIKSFEIDNKNCKYQTMGIQCKLIDFGMSRFMIGDELIGCDDNATHYNPCFDLQYLFLSIIEDFEACEHQAPRFFAWLNKTCLPIKQYILKKVPNYLDYDDSEQHRIAQKELQILKCPDFEPKQMLKTLQLHWSNVNI